MEVLSAIIKAIKNVVMSVIDIARIFKFKTDDENESKILDIISDTIDSVADEIAVA